MTRALLLALLLAAAVRATPVAAQASFAEVDAFQLHGAYGLIIVPKNWNGAFIVYAHGYTADPNTIKPYPSDITPANFGTKLEGGDQVLRVPLTFGYAVGTTTYRSAGWAVADAYRDVEAVRRRFVSRHGKPTFTYVWGHSEGGMVTQTVIEKYPGTYDGALPFCAPGAGGRRNFDGAWDLRAVYEAVCAQVVPSSALVCGLCTDGRTRCLGDEHCPAGQSCGRLEPNDHPENGVTRECLDFLTGHPGTANEQPKFDDFVAKRTTACFGGATKTPEQAARRSLYERATSLSGAFVETDLFFASVGMGEVYWNRTHRQHPWGNVGVTFPTPALTPAEAGALAAALPRHDNDPGGAKYMQRYFEPRGRTQSLVLTLHAIDDGLVQIANEEKYREAFHAAGRDMQLVQTYTPTGGHCGFSAAEHVAAFFGLTNWVENGVRPSAASMQESCDAIAPLAGGPCRIQTFDPPEWGSRVVERPQRGIRPESLVCDDHPGDCPAGTSCGADFTCE